MASVKIEIRNKVYKNGKSPIVIRYTEDRKTFRKQIFTIEKKYWDSVKYRVKKSHHSHRLLNQKIIDILAAYESEINVKGHVSQFRVKDVDLTLASVIRLRSEKSLSFNKIGTHLKFATSANKIERFKDVPIDSVNFEYVKKYEKHLQGIGNNKNTIAKEMAVIKSTLNLFDIQHSPFRKYKLTFEPTYKQKLDYAEWQKFNAINPKGLARDVWNIWRFQVLARGARIGDTLLLKWANISDDRLSYTEQKGVDKFNLKMPDLALDILAEYDKNSEYIFPFLMSLTSPKDVYAEIKRKTALCNKYLKKLTKLAGIDKKISTHSARHTFALIYMHKKKDIRGLQELLQHSRYETTEIYAKDLTADDRLDKDVEGLLD